MGAGYGLGFDPNWLRDVGYSVPATCDYPDCNTDIDRGLAYVCGGDTYGGEFGCGLFFCDRHLGYTPIDPCTREVSDWDALYEKYGVDADYSDVEDARLCERCAMHESPFTPTPDVEEWARYKAATTYFSWLTRS